MTPEVFGEFLLVERQSGRSMSEVFLAVRLGDRAGRLLVVKRPALGERASGAVAEALRREAEVLGARAWPGVAALDSSGTIAGLPYVAVEHVRGLPLDQLLSGSPLSPAAAVVVGRDLARTLSELHAAGWVHGDVTPSNVIVDDTGEISLVDFGLARKVGESRAGPSGKPGYASPAAALGRPAAPDDDVYAWGAVVAECLLGRALFRETDLVEAGTRSAELPSAVVAQPSLAAALALDRSARPRASDLAALEAAPGARAVLAERVRRAAAGEMPPPPPERTLVVQAKQPSAAALPSVPSPAAPHQQLLQRPMVYALIAGLALFTLVGFFVGRRTVKNANNRQATISLPALPARSEIKIDGRTVVVSEAGRPMPIEPGKHTITVTLAREEKQYDVYVEPGDHVVLVPIARTPKSK
jgi:serine/threonine protein kinase